MYLICHVTSQDYAINWSYDFMGWESSTVCHRPFEFGGYRHCDRGDKMFLMYQVTSSE